MKRFVSIILMLSMAVCLLTACGKKEEAEPVTSSDVGVKVITTTFPAYDWCREIIKGNEKFINLEYLVDGNLDMHNYQPSADDIVKYKEADLVICIGGESEEWVTDLGLPQDKIMYLMDYINALPEEWKEGMMEEEEPEGIEEGEEGTEYDEHIWLSLRNAKLCVDKIADRFGDIDYLRSEDYRNNANDYILRLNDLDEEFEEAVKQAKVKTLLFADRFPFRYMVNDYGLDYYAAFMGCSAETEVTFDVVRYLANKVDELGLNCICTIGEGSSVADTVRLATEMKDQDDVVFNAMQAIPNSIVDKHTYEEYMRSNLESLKHALGGLD